MLIISYDPNFFSSGQSLKLFPDAQESCRVPANTTSLYNKDAHANGEFQTLVGDLPTPSGLLWV